MVRKLTSSEHALLQLVAMGMGNSSYESIPEGTNWADVYRLAKEQNVVGITFNAYQKLAKAELKGVSANDPSMELLYLQWLGMTAKHEQRYQQHQKAIRDLSALYSKQGIKLMVLKGYGLSLNYPTPSLRPCGDIDIWLRGRQKEADELMVQRTGIMPIKSSHHTIFDWQGCEVENHITILEYDTHKSNIKMDKIFTGFAEEGEEEIEVEGQRVLLPTPRFNAHFLLRHNSMHFAVEKITIRHLLDWATFVKKYSRSIDWDELFSFARKSNVDKFLCCQNSICVRYLHFDEDLFPVPKRYEQLETRILLDILSPEFDQEIPSIKSDFINYCLIKTKRLWKNRWKNEITNTDSFIASLLCYGWNRIRETILKIR